METSLYRRLYPTVEAQVLQHIKDHGQVHGSAVRDYFIEYAKGRFFVDDHAEKLLRDLVEDGILEVLHREPSVSQAAFIGLSYSNKAYSKTPWGPGTVEHYWYRLAKVLGAS
jgi:hypothetical protein